MKKFFLAFILLIPVLCPAQEFYKILYLRPDSIGIGNRVLRTGDSFRSDEVIRWLPDTKQIMKFCYDGCTKQKVVTSQIWQAAVKKSKGLHPHLFIAERLSGRGMIKASGLPELRSYFGRTLGLVDRIVTPVGNAFPMDENHFFYVSYTYKGEVINKKLGHYGQKLIIDRSVYLIDKVPFPPVDMDMNLYYYNAENKTTRLITDHLRLLPVDRSELEDWLTGLDYDIISEQDCIEFITDYIQTLHPDVWISAGDVAGFVETCRLKK